MAATPQITRRNPAEAAFEPLGVVSVTDDHNFHDRTHPLGTTVYYRVTVTYGDGTQALPFQSPIVYRAV
jgi:hypothetical protein